MTDIITGHVADVVLDSAGGTIIAGKVADALLDAVAEWDLAVDMGYPFKVTGTAQELIMVMISFAADQRVSRADAMAVSERVITEELDDDKLIMTLVMTNLIIG